MGHARHERASGLLREGGGLVVLVPLWLWWIAGDGGFDRLTWLPAAAWLAVAAVVLHRRVPRAPLDRAAAIAVVALGGLAGLAAISVAWADDRGAAWTGAQRAALVAVAVALAILWPASARLLRGALVTFGGGVLVAAVAALVHVRGDPDGLVDGRLVGPAGYVNASAALLVMAAVALIALAAVPRGRQDRTDTAGTAALLGAAGALAALTLLTQSRGAMVTAAAAAVVAVAVAHDRRRALLGLGLVAAIVAALRDPLLDLRLVAQDDPAAGAARALWGCAAIAALSALAGTVLAAVPASGRRRPQVPAALGRRRRRAVVTVAALLVVTAVGTTAGGARPVSWADERVRDFTTEDYEQLEARPTRLGGGLGSNRSDYWRVALRAGAQRPLTGLGVEGFGPEYLRERRSDRAPRFAHSVWAGTFAELGAPGLVLLLAAAAALTAGWRTALRRTSGPPRALVAAAGLPAVALLVHGSADWSPAFCGLTVPALALLGSASRLDAAGLRRRGGPAGRTLALAACLTTLTAAPLFAAAQLERRAFQHAPAHTGRAVADLQLAARLDPVGPEPALLQAIVLLRAGDARGARAAYRRALQRDPHAWFPHLVLGAADARHHPARAVAHLRLAQRLDPRERLVDHVLATVLRGSPVDPLDVQERAISLPD